MGTKNDIAWFQKIMQRHTKIEVTEVSDLLKGRKNITGLIWK